MACFNISGSLSACHTLWRGAGMISSPLIFMGAAFLCAASLLRFARRFPLFLRRAAKLLEPSLDNCLTDALHQLLVIGDIRPAEQHHAEKLARFDQMMEVGAGIFRRGRT